MDGDKVILAHHGQWQGHIYRTRTESLIFWPVLKTSLDEFMDLVHSIVEADLTKYKYVLYCLVSLEDSQVKSRIFTTRDLHRAAKMLATPKFFVTLDWRKPHKESPPCNDQIPTVQRLQTSVVSRNKHPRPPSYSPPSTYYPPSAYYGTRPSSAPVAKSKAVNQPNKVAKVFEGQTAGKNLCGIDGGNHDEVRSDDEDKVIVAHQGCWRGQIYKPAMESLIFLPLLKTSFDEFVDLVHRIVEADQTKFKYVLHCLLSHVKWRILSTQDLHRAAKMFKTPKFFVTLDCRLPTPSHPTNVVKSKASQGAFGDNQIPTVHCFPTSDDEDKVILAHHGEWKGQLYHSGTESLIFWPLLKTSFDEFVDLVHRVVEADQTRFKYVLTCVISHEYSQVKWRIVSTQDLHRAAKMFKTPKFFVSLDWSDPTPSPPSNEVKTRASQGAFGDDQIPTVHCFQTGDSEDKIIVAYHGDWVGRKYQSGKESLVFWPLLKTSFDEFMDLVHRIVGFNQTIFKYVLHCLVSHEDSLVKWRMLSTQDLHRAAKVFKTPKFFMTSDWRLPAPPPPSNEGKSKASQGAFGDDQMDVNQPNKVAKVFEGQTAGKNLCGIDGSNHDEVSSDDEDKVIVAYNGDWSGWKYQYGTESLFFMPSLLKTSLDEFMDFVHRIVEADQTTFKYVLHCRVSNEDSQVKSRILSTQDLHRAAKMFKTPKFFVTLDRLPTPSPPHEVKSKASQGAFGDQIPPGHHFPTSSRGLNYGKGNYYEVSSDSEASQGAFGERILAGYHVPANGHGLNYGKGNHNEVSSNNEVKSKASQGAFGDRIPTGHRFPTSSRGLNNEKGNHNEVSSDDEDYKNESWVEVVRKTIYDNLGWEEDEYFIPEDVPWGRLTPPVGLIIGGLNERVLRSRRIPMEHTFEDWWPRVLSRLPGCGVAPAGETVTEVVDETVVEVLDSWSSCLKKSSV
ncbi:hypothetical protein SASPL_151470 [Salvia splendens]|uniref:Uncharacterized protein n=1 Tax=Salvia splendens TaxID=180675 RepID=A0A8X8W9B6_SALSN|nr:uncharacterized protein LOC121780824 [Salvia splendens]XP_042034394.1 uncharacterized protein LOC121780824 [Salvia splendens]XP_042034395.1 uncharacterized protein LOC121780824 [Salvia splendens]KAG6389994.1 hypothetical protein SASPL_151470 [Salvia splendens]